jgi:hypothetical protein
VNGAQRRKLVEDATRRARLLFSETRRFAEGGSASMVSPDLSDGWKGDAVLAERTFQAHLEAALRIPSLQRAFSVPWPEEACAVLPTRAASATDCMPVWASIVAWCALDALGCIKDAEDPDRSAAVIIDSLRLREPLAETLSALGLSGEERWRAVARVRASLAHASWAPGSAATPGRATAPFSWLHDPDVAWLVGVHEYEGVRYFNKEAFERLLWWMALPALIRIASQPSPDPSQIKALQQELVARMRSAEEAGYRVEALLETTR